MSALVKELSDSLKSDRSDRNRKKWASNIIEQGIPLKDLTEILYAQKPINTRFTWLLGYICELSPSTVFPIITYLFTNRHEIDVLNFNRSLAKMFWLCGIPDEIEGEAADEMFKWMLNPIEQVSVKSYALFALTKLAAKHPDLKNELEWVIKDQLTKNSASFKKRAEKILQQLDKL